MTTRAPSSANRTADAWPMPDAAPEITAVLPSCLFFIDCLPFLAARLCACALDWRRYLFARPKI